MRARGVCARVGMGGSWAGVAGADSGPGEGVADRGLEVALLSVFGDVDEAVTDDDARADKVGEREVGVDGEADPQVWGRGP